MIPECLLVILFKISMVTGTFCKSRYRYEHCPYGCCESFEHQGTLCCDSLTAVGIGIGSCVVFFVIVAILLAIWCCRRQEHHRGTVLHVRAQPQALVNSGLQVYTQAGVYPQQPPSPGTPPPPYYEIPPSYPNGHTNAGFGADPGSSQPLQKEDLPPPPPYEP